MSTGRTDETAGIDHTGGPDIFLRAAVARDADVPELAIGVDGPWRGRGVGGLLLRALTTAAAATGIARVSLSVERANLAMRLYLREGFVAVGSRPHAVTMVTRLRPGA